MAWAVASLGLAKGTLMTSTLRRSSGSTTSRSADLRLLRTDVADAKIVVGPLVSVLDSYLLEALLTKRPSGVVTPLNWAGSLSVRFMYLMRLVCAVHGGLDLGIVVVVVVLAVGIMVGMAWICVLMLGIVLTLCVTRCVSLVAVLRCEQQRIRTLSTGAWRTVWICYRVCLCCGCAARLFTVLLMVTDGGAIRIRVSTRVSWCRRWALVVVCWCL